MITPSEFQPAPFSAAGKVRDVLWRSALNIHLFQFAAGVTPIGENHPAAIVGPGRGHPVCEHLCLFRAGQRADFDAIERADIIVAQRHLRR